MRVKLIVWRNVNKRNENDVNINDKINVYDDININDEINISDDIKINDEININDDIDINDEININICETRCGERKRFQEF